MFTNAIDVSVSSPLIVESGYPVLIDRLMHDK